MNTKFWRIIQLVLVLKRLFRFLISGCCIKVKKKNQRRRSQTNLSHSNSKRTDLKSHLVREHGMDERNALGMKSQLGMYKIKKRKPEHLRKTKPRFYHRKSCAYPGCHKVRDFWWYLILRCKEDPLKCPIPIYYLLVRDSNFFSLLHRSDN